MNILFVIPSLTQVEQKKYDMACKQLVRLSQISFVVLTKKENLQSENLRQNIVFYQLHKNKSLISIPKLRKIINIEKPDIIISSIINANFASVISTLFLGKNKPLNIIRLSNDLEFISKSSFRNKLMLFTSIFLGKKIVILSDQNYVKAVNKFHFVKEKFLKIENPIIIQKFLKKG